MSIVLIVAESQPDGHLRKATLHAIAAGKDLAQKTGAPLHLAVLAENPSALAEQLKPYGAAVIHTVASPAFAHYVAESYAPAVAALASSIGADFVGAAATAQGRDLQHGRKHQQGTIASAAEGPNQCATVHAGALCREFLEPLQDVRDAVDFAAETHGRPFWFGQPRRQALAAL